MHNLQTGMINKRGHRKQRENPSVIPDLTPVGLDNVQQMNL